MNYTLNIHGENRVPIPNGLPELMSDISREVLRQKPIDILRFIADYLDAQLLARAQIEQAVDFVDDILYKTRKEILNVNKYGITEETANKMAAKIQALYRGNKVRLSKQKINEQPKIEPEEKGAEDTGDQLKLFSDDYIEDGVKYFKVPDLSFGELSVMMMPTSKIEMDPVCPDDTLQHELSSFTPVKRENAGIMVPIVKPEISPLNVQTEEMENK